MLLAERCLTMRVAVRGCHDAVEFRFRGGQWFGEAGDLVEITFHEATLESERDRQSWPEQARPISLSAIAGGDIRKWLNQEREYCADMAVTRSIS